MCIIFVYTVVTIALFCTIFELFDVQNIMTLKPRLQVTQDHWKWHHRIDRIRDDNGSVPEMTMGQWVTGHGSSGSTNPSGSRGSRVSTPDPLTHDQVNKIPKTGITG